MLLPRHHLLDRRHEHWMLASMLLALHTALDAGVGTSFARALMLAHLGLFFLWQPIWQRDRRLDVQGIVVIGLLSGGMLWLLSWPLVFAWLTLLIGILAGRSFSTRRERYVYLFSLAFVVAELLLTVTVKLFLDNALTPAFAGTVRIGLYLLPAALYAIPPITVPSRAPFPVDFFRGITFALLTALLAVFSVLITLRMGLEYPLALIATLMALGLFLFFLSWITTPAAGSIGLLAVWEKSVLNIGTPFESWLGSLADLAEREHEPEAFLAAAIEALCEIPWITGAAWHATASRGQRGVISPHALDIHADGLDVTLHTERAFSSAVVIHCHLLIQVLGHFYAAKRREREQASAAHLRAIHETGARVTHDIKNLLQSLKTMAGAIAEAGSDSAQAQRGFALLARRLPDIVQRLQLALDKLQRPAPPALSTSTAEAWWQTLCDRYDGSGIAFTAALDDAQRPVATECFDSVVDNLIDNARHKIAAGAATRVTIDAGFARDAAWVRVTDDGHAIPAALAAQLLHRPVASTTGLGVGLYQAARLAAAAGCTLALVENRDGAVCFDLRCERRESVEGSSYGGDAGDDTAHGVNASGAPRTD